MPGTGIAQHRLALGLGLLLFVVMVWAVLNLGGDGDSPTEQPPGPHLFQEGVPTSCADCHVTLSPALAQPVYDFNASIHFGAAVTCVDCHGGDMTDTTILGSMSPAAGYIGIPDDLVAAEKCGVCHPVESARYRSSIHYARLAGGNADAATCTDCHGAHRVLPSANRASLTYPQTEPGSCGACHAQPLEDYEQGIHWQRIQEGDFDGATCSDCHGPHEIREGTDPASRTHQTNEARTCAACHSDPAVVSAWYYGIKTDQLESYQESYHSRALKYGDEAVATCSDCHENHGVRAPTDPASSVHPNNLPATCGACHATAYSPTIVQGLVHDRETAHSADLRWDKSGLTPAQQGYYLGPFDLGFYVPLFFQILIPSVLVFLIAVVALENVRVYLEGRRK